VRQLAVRGGSQRTKARSRAKDLLLFRTMDVLREGISLSKKKGRKRKTSQRLGRGGKGNGNKKDDKVGVCRDNQISLVTRV